MGVCQINIVNRPTIVLKRFGEKIGMSVVMNSIRAAAIFVHIHLVFIAARRRHMAHKKPNLPMKDCKSCGRPFTWRKKWERVWDDVRYCSERCKRMK